MTSTSLHLSADALVASPDRFAALVEPDLGPATILSNGQPMTLAEVVDHEARAYHAWGTPAGKFLAGQMERLAQLVRWTGANTPEEHEARMEVWDDEVREQCFERGYREGLEAGRQQAARMRSDGRD